MDEGSLKGYETRLHIDIHEKAMNLGYV